MVDYRVYGLGPAGSFVSVHEFRRYTDVEALEAARALALRDGFEVWDRGRPVAILKRRSDLDRLYRKGAERGTDGALSD